MASIINFPDFMNNNIILKSGKLNKIYYFLYGILIGFIHKNANKNIFCFFMNLFFRKENKIYYKNGMYSKKLNSLTISYPNKRIDRVIINHNKHFNFFLETYCLDGLKVSKDDLVVDCGANVGELFYALKLKNDNFNYIGFEPDPVSFECLKSNLFSTENKAYKIALGDKTGTADLFIDSDGGDSSLVYFGKEKKIQVETRTLDTFNFENIKLLKLEAEGYEFEVLKGAANTLRNIQYITVDYGPEKGVNEETSKADVTNYLYANDFSLISGSKYRQVGLFKNNRLLKP